jgi:hypothetical protein
MDPESMKNYRYRVEADVYDDLHPHRSFAVDSTGIVFEDETGAPIACPVPAGTREAYDSFRRSLAVDFGARGLWLFDPSGASTRLSPSDPALLSPWRDGISVSFEAGRGLWAYDPNGWRQLAPWEPTLLVSGSSGDRLFAAFGSGRGLYVYDAAGSTKIDDRTPVLMEPFGTGLAVAFGPGDGLDLWMPVTGWLPISSSDPLALREVDGSLVAAFPGRGVLAVFSGDLAYFDWMPEAYWWIPLTDWEPEQLSRFRVEFGWWGNGITADFGAGRGIWLGDRQLEANDPYLLVDHDSDLVAAFRSGPGLRLYDEATGWTTLSPWQPTHVVSAETYLAAAFGRRGLYRYDAAGWTRLRRWSVESMVAVRLESASGRRRRRRIVPGP